MMSKDYIKVTEGGRLYIKTKDFFKDKRVQKLITKIKDSNLYKKINEQ